MFESEEEIYKFIRTFFERLQYNFYAQTKLAFAQFFFIEVKRHNNCTAHTWLTNDHFTFTAEIFSQQFIKTVRRYINLLWLSFNHFEKKATKIKQPKKERKRDSKNIGLPNCWDFENVPLVNRKHWSSYIAFEKFRIKMREKFVFFFHQNTICCSQICIL